MTRILFSIFFSTDESSRSIQVIEPLSINAEGNGPLGNWLNNLIESTPVRNLFSIVLAGILVVLNAVQLNSIFIRNSSFKENTYIPAAYYVIFMSSSKDFYFFSPALLASSIILVGLNYLFYHMKYRGTEENIISTGFMVGLAGLIYVPSAWLYLFILLSYLMYSNTIRRRYFLMTWGFLMPIVIFWLFYFWMDLGAHSLSMLGNQIVKLSVIQVAPAQIAVPLGFGLIIALSGFLSSFNQQGKTNHQILVQHSMSWLAFFAIVIVILYACASLLSAAFIVASLSFSILN